MLMSIPRCNCNCLVLALSCHCNLVGVTCPVAEKTRMFSRLTTWPNVADQAGMVPRPWCWMPWLVRALGQHRIVGCSKLNSGTLGLKLLRTSGKAATKRCSYCSRYEDSLMPLWMQMGMALAPSWRLFCGHDHSNDVPRPSCHLSVRY